jgi:uncharacterized membrane protein YagU involved in acid resistance
LGRHLGIEANPPQRPSAFHTILFGGLIVGVLDILDAIIFYRLWFSISPIRILQSVARGILGRAAFNGGLKTALLGLLLHFLIATIWAAIFYLLCRLLPLLIRHAVLAGLSYGVAVHFIMTFVVVPLSAVGPRTGPAPWAVFLNGVIGHALLVGLPIALIARRSAKASPPDERSSS